MKKFVLTAAAILSATCLSAQSWQSLKKEALNAGGDFTSLRQPYCSIVRQSVSMTWGRVFLSFVKLLWSTRTKVLWKHVLLNTITTH